MFLVVRELFEFAGRRTKSYEGYDRIMARYAPTVADRAAGACGPCIVLIAFVPMYWAFGVTPWREAVITSGSSFTTLGFDRPGGPGRRHPLLRRGDHRARSSSPCSSATCRRIYGAFSPA